MRKLFLFLVIVIFPFLIQAEVYQVNDIKLKINFDEDFIVFTRDNLNDNQALMDLGVSQEYMIDNMNSNNIYLDVIKEDMSYEFLVVSQDRLLLFEDLKTADVKTLTVLEDELTKQTNSSVVSVSEGNNVYVKLDYYDNNTGNYIVNYYTVVNHRGYNFQMQKKSIINEEEKEELRKIISSVEIEVVKKEEVKEDTNNIKTNKTIKHLIIGAIIGLVAGLISYLTILIIKKKKSSK